MVSLTKRKAIKIIESTNREYERFLCNLNRRYHARPESLSPEAAVLAQQYDDVYRCVNSSLWQFYKNTKSGDLKAILDEYLALCRNFNFRTLQSFPKEEFTVSETEDKMPEAIEAALEKLEKYGDEQIQKAARQCREGKRIIEFSNMDERQNGQTYRVNDFYSHYITDQFRENTMENQIRLAVTLAHELKRNAATDSLEAETQEIVLSDTKIIESFENAYGEGIYKKFPEYGILHYIKKIFGETELKEFADYAFDSTGSYWKVNEAGDLADDGNAKKVFDRDGKEQPLAFESKNTGRQGTLEKWLGLKDAFTALLKSAGYKWNGAEWIENHGKIDHKVIEKAYEDGKLTDDQYNMIQLAAGIMPDAEQKKESLFKAFLEEIQKANRIKTQIQVDIVNRAWEFFFGKKTKSKKSANNSNSTSNQRSKTVELSELDRFIEIVRNTVGASYDHARSPTETKMDCSGVFVYAMKQLGYKIDKHLTAARMASGQIPGIIIYEMVDNDRQGNKGVLNFYKWGTSTVQHVNYGVGQNENEIDLQIIDASEGDTWQTIRNNNEKQVKKAKKNTVNQTWAPFSTKNKPDIQAYLDFSKFNKEIEIK